MRLSHHATLCREWRRIPRVPHESPNRHARASSSTASSACSRSTAACSRRRRTTAVPLLERLRFIIIVSSNLDEFFEIRVAGPEGADQARPARARARRRWRRRGVRRGQPRGARAGRRAVPAAERDGAAGARARGHRLPAARGMERRRSASGSATTSSASCCRCSRRSASIPAHPFPRVLNKSLNFAVELEGRDAFGRSSRAAIVQAPRALPRVIRLPQAIAGAEYAFVFLSSILHAHVGELFAGMNVLGCYQFRVTRNSDLFVDEEEIKNLHTALQGELAAPPLRRRGAPGSRRQLLAAHGRVPAAAVRPARGRPLPRRGPGEPRTACARCPTRSSGPTSSTRRSRPGCRSALDGARPVRGSCKKQDVLLHHPFQSFLPVIDFIRTRRPTTRTCIAIKQTVYRTGTDSELMEILVDAARKGKEVTVVVELMARFDEEANIELGGAPARRSARTSCTAWSATRRTPRWRWSCAARSRAARCCAATCTSAPATTTRAPRALYTDFGLFTANEEIVRRRARGVPAAHRPRPRRQAEARAGSRRSRCTSASSPRSRNEAQHARPRQARRASSPR